MHDNIKKNKNIDLHKNFMLSEEEIKCIKNEKLNYENPLAASIEALKIVQKKHGWVPDKAIYAIADLLGINAVDVEGVATFYSQIFRKPVGKHIIRYCDSVVCYITGYLDILNKIEKILNIKPGQTTEDGVFTLLPICCLGNCDKGPCIMIDDNTYANLTISSISSLLMEYLNND